MYTWHIFIILYDVNSPSFKKNITGSQVGMILFGKQVFTYKTYYNISIYTGYYIFYKSCF